MKTKLERLAARFPWKRVFVIAGCICGLMLLIAAGVWVREKSRARPLFGIFDIGSHCMGGHEIFLTLEETAAFDECPGHRSKKHIGRIERTGNEVIVHRLKDDAPYLRISWDGTGHSLTYNDRPRASASPDEQLRRIPLPQVTNPFRTRLPRYLPED